MTHKRVMHIHVSPTVGQHHDGSYTPTNTELQLPTPTLGRTRSACTWPTLDSPSPTTRSTIRRSGGAPHTSGLVTRRFWAWSEMGGIKTGAAHARRPWRQVSRVTTSRGRLQRTIRAQCRFAFTPTRSSFRDRVSALRRQSGLRT